MLNAVGAPLVLRNFGEDSGSLIKQFVHDTILSSLFKVLECVLDD